MRKTINHPYYGEIAYEEGIWSGKKSISINGVALKSLKKNVFAFGEGENSVQVTVRGGVLTGVALCIQNEEIWIYSKPTWFDWVFAVLPFVLMIVWGNSVRLCSIIPVVGGAIGGALGGLAMVVTMLLIREKGIARKILMTLLATLVTFIIGAALGYVIVFAFLV
jgi:hypothetical protein